MSTLQAEATNLISQMSDANLISVIEYMHIIAPSKDNTLKVQRNDRIGVAKGKFTVPDDFDKDDEEIAKLFNGE